MTRPVRHIALAAFLVVAAIPGASACSVASDSYMGTVCAVPYYRGCPTGWLPADGQLVAIGEYSALFQLIGTTYGGDGVEKFALPDLRGRIVAGAGAAPGQPAVAVGKAFGSESLQMNSSNLPAHTHAAQTQSTVAATLRAQSADAGKAGPASNVQAKLTPVFGRNAAAEAQPASTLGYSSQATNVDMHASSIVVAGNVNHVIGTTGGAVPLPNFQPTLVLVQCINVFGIFPSPADAQRP